MRLPRPSILAVILGLTMSCSSPKEPAVTPAAPSRPLAGMSAQRVMVTPVFSLVAKPDLPWSSSIGRQQTVMRQLDADIASELRERGLRDWVFAEALVRSYQANPTYAADPYRLAMEPLRDPKLPLGSRLGEPLATQVRTMVALSDGRYVLAPVELRFERVGSGSAGRGVLRLALLDARSSEVRWLGEAVGDTASAYSPAITASVAAKLADMIVAP